MVKAIKVQGPSNFDSQWINLIFTLEDSSGKLLTHFLDIPTTAEKSFMYGAKKSLNEYSKLEKFLRGFGVELKFEEAIHQIADLFSDPEEVFVGKTFSARVGYYGNYTKYVGKDGDVSQVKILDKNGNPAVDKAFAGYDAANAYAKENNIKLQGFAKILDVVPASVSAITSSTAPKSDLPF
jgi:hypothetical protein